MRRDTPRGRTAARCCWSKTLPQVGWEVEIGQSNRLMRQLDAHKLDLAIVSGPVDETKFRTASLGADRMIWAVSAELLARHQPFELDTFLRSVPIWCVQRESFYWHAAAFRRIARVYGWR